MTESPNAEHIGCWADIVAPKYTRFRHIAAGGLGAHSDAALERIRPAPGSRVLDVGCGMGESTVALARIVGEKGTVIGIDGVPSFLDIARREAEEAGLRQITYVQGDAQQHRFDAPFDFVFSRFGTMFFQSPVAALRNVRKQMIPGAPLAMVVWRRVDDNPWIAASKAIAIELLPPVPESAPNCGPGPFSMASADVVTDVLRGAGFARPTVERLDCDVLVGANVDETIAFQLALGPTGELFRLAGEEGERQKPELERRLRELYASYVRDDGSVWVTSSSWLVTGRA